jgi:hypothetical protein
LPPARSLRSTTIPGITSATSSKARELEEGGKPERSLTPGIAYYTHATADQPVFWHMVWNTSQTRPRRTLSVLIIDKGFSGTVFDKPQRRFISTTGNGLARLPK